MAAGALRFILPIKLNIATNVQHVATRVGFGRETADGIGPIMWRVNGGDGFSVPIEINPYFILQ